MSPNLQPLVEILQKNADAHPTERGAQQAVRIVEAWVRGYTRPVECPRCMGNGIERLAGPADDYPEVECPRCSGSGVVS